MNEERFWEMIEAARTAVGGRAFVRARLARGALSDEAAQGPADALGRVVPALRGSLQIRHLAGIRLERGRLEGVVSRRPTPGDGSTVHALL
ncbi:MAG TPA: hypothetical protein VKT77_21360 [Chthonomonadaceae bacterium]|nr:hypothetical protein [Chthonomonadaceae bacterium]